MTAQAGIHPTVTTQVGLDDNLSGDIPDAGV
jgi:hypothetical protein